MRWGRNLILVLMGIFGFYHEGMAAENIPFRPGEKLYFRVYWTGIQAGEAMLEVMPMEQYNDAPAYHFLMVAKTFPFVDMFYKVRDRIESYTDVNMSHALLYKEKKEGKSKKDVYITYDWEKLLVQYSEDGEKRDPVALLPGAFDPLSVFYFFRMHELMDNLEFVTPVSDGKKCVEGKAKIVKKGNVKVAGTVYETFLVEPDLKDIGGVFQKSPGAKLQIWVTADARRIPVLIKSKVSVGHFSVELAGIENQP